MGHSEVVDTNFGFQFKNQTVKMYLMPMLLLLYQFFFYHFQLVPESQFTAWDKLISRFSWAGARRRIRFKTQGN